MPTKITVRIETDDYLTDILIQEQIVVSEGNLQSLPRSVFIWGEQMLESACKRLGPMKLLPGEE